ncbi:MAG TPA: glycosyltransferase, partial [Thermoplasmatales archaeon]|nr:glycosyltransferase [Thermoplasmatales archaeon]
MARRQTKIEPRGLAVTFAVSNLILIIVEAVYLILRMRDIILYPHSPVVPHWVEIGVNIILFSVLFFILFLSTYLSLAVISKVKGYRRTAKLRLSDILPKDKYPTVTIAIFTFNEPVEMVKKSIETNYFNIDYPRDKLQLAVCDDSTEEEYWAPLAEYVDQLAKEGHKVFLIHRVIRKGRKAGAFNELINNYADTDYVAIADADYMFNPDFLEKTIPFFYTEENVFAVQTPQFFRNGDNTWISRLASNIQQWFYNFLGTFKDKDNAFFFCGTCGVIDLEKAKAVQMEEKAITEDLEMSTEAITKHGWVTLYVDEVMTSGIGPEMMGQLVGQYMRYSRGNLWSLRQHLADIILSNKMTFKQKVHYFHNNAALMMGVAMLIVLLEPFLFLFLDIAGPNIPVFLTLLLFFMGNLNFYIVYGKSFREFLYHLFFMNVMVFKLTAQFIKGFVLNSPGEFIRTAKISATERSIRKRLKYVFSLFWLEILTITGLWFILLFKTGILTPEMFTTLFTDLQTQGIIDFIINLDI